ncbi:unnamed protein product [Rhizoctonia solani]|uniref:Uncharacterized protein n=1 Tax=Rhizoctonia solani TaxID=456999 RepID=A0A8H3GK94_9AGAM|nr:unnamed protein product [Rhizoctonia solani]
MSDNEPHPLATLPVLDLGVCVHFLSNPGEIPVLKPSVCGRMVSLQSDTNSPKPTLKDAIVVWDWTEGVEILRIPFPTGCILFPVFVSEEYLIVTRTPETQVPTNQGLGITQLGRLFVYKLGSVPFEASHVATFELPKLSAPHKVYRVSVHSGSPPLPRTPHWLARYKYTPRIYDTARDAQLLCLSITSVRKFKEAWHPTDIFVSVPIRTFLDYLKTADSATYPTLTPWSAWRSKASLCYPCASSSAALLSISGLRHSIRDFCYFADKSRETVLHDSLALFDSDPQRLKLSRAEGRKERIFASYPYDRPPITLLDVQEAEPDEEPGDPTPSYTKASVNLDMGLVMRLEYVPTFIDDEHSA